MSRQPPAASHQPSAPGPPPPAAGPQPPASSPQPPPSYPRGNLFIPGPAGPLECIAWDSGVGSRWAVVSHAHPQHGGVMHFKVIFRTARVLQGAGYSVIRYNFRGVGHSAGSYDGGRGEADDLRAVLDHLQKERGQEKVLLAGFSFGAWISARVGCPDPRAERLLFLGLAGAFFDLGAAEEMGLERCDKPIAVVQGDRDQFGELSRVAALVGSMPRANLQVVEGADHFFTGRLPEMERAVSSALRGLEGGPVSPGP